MREEPEGKQPPELRLKPSRYPSHMAANTKQQEQQNRFFFFFFLDQHCLETSKQDQARV